MRQIVKREIDAEQIVCDVCGVTLRPVSYSESLTVTINAVAYDLCPVCVEVFWAWLPFLRDKVKLRVIEGQLVAGRGDD